MTSQRKTLKIKITPTFKGRKITEENLKKYLLYTYPKKTEYGNTTHTFMDGGVMNVEGNKEMKKLYRFLATFDSLPPITERLNKKGMTFKFFLDIDEKGDDNDNKIYYTDEEVKEYVREINKLLEELGIKTEHILMKNDTINKYHIIYDFTVELQTAYKLVDYLEEKTTLNLDSSVYRGGLRILKARKNKENMSRYYIMESSKHIKKKNDIVKCSIFDLYNQTPLDIETIPTVENNEYEIEDYKGEHKDVELTEDEEQLLEIVKKEYTELKNISFETNSYNGYDMDYDHSHLCPVSLKKHDKIKCYIKKFRDDSIKLYCYSQKCRAKSITLQGGNSLVNDEFFTDTKLAHLFVEHYGENFIYQNKKLYYWNYDKWERGVNAENKMNNIISNEFYKIVQNIILENCGDDKLTWTKKSLCLLSRKLKPYVIKEIYGLITDTNIIFDNNNLMDYCLNFTNGLLDLQKIKDCVEGDYSKAFRRRVKGDYVCHTLDYEFSPKVDKKRNEKVDLIFSQQLPNENEKEFIMRWFAYCLTADTSQQKYLCSIGYSASNGKSTQSKIFSNCLPIYSLKFDNRTFSENYAKSHKQFIHLADRPVRFTYIEEIEQSKMNNNLLKDYVDGDEMNTEILYGTSTGIKIKSKLNICSNKDLSIYNADEGDLRRGIQLNFNVKFIQKAKYDALSNKANYAVGDKYLIKNMLSDTLNKNAFIHLLLERITDVINNGLEEDKFINNNFKETMTDYDGFKTFINDTYERTEDDYVSIGDLLDNYKETNNKITRNILIKEIKRIGLVYDRRKSVNGSRGCVKGLKLLNGNNDFVD